jgi:hypothetical protein
MSDEMVYRTVYTSLENWQRIEQLAKQQHRSTNNMAEALLLQALDGDGHAAPDPRIVELVGDYFRGRFTADEALHQIAALVFTPSVSDKQMRLELPTEVQA